MILQQSLPEYLKNNLPNINMFNEQERTYVCNVITSISLRAPSLIHINNSDCYNLPAERTRKHFNDNNKYKLLYSLYFDFISCDYKINEYTREIRLKDFVYQIISEFNNYSKNKLIDADTNRIVKTIPEKTILQKDKYMNNKKCNIQLESNYVKTNDENFRALIDFVKRCIQENTPELFHKHLQPRIDVSDCTIKYLKSELVYLIALRAQTFNDLHPEPGFVVQYKEIGTSRIFNFIQSIPSYLRKVIFSGYDIDINNSLMLAIYSEYHSKKNLIIKKNKRKHDAVKYFNKKRNDLHRFVIDNGELKRNYIFPKSENENEDEINYTSPERNYTTCFKIPESNLRAIEYYLKNKNLIREQLMKELDLPIEKVKQLLISLCNGARLPKVPARESRLFIEVCNRNINVYNRILSNQIISELKKDFEIAKKFILKHSVIINDKGDLYLQNLMKKNELIKKAKYSKSVRDVLKSNQKFSHIVFGIENKILETACKFISDVTILIHDGFISNSDFDLDELIKSVKDEFQYFHDIDLKYLSFSKEKLNFDIDTVK